MKKGRLRWYGHACRRNEEDDVKKVTNVRVDGRRGRRRPKHRWKDTVNAELKLWSLETEDTEERVRWRSLTELGALQKPVT